MIGFLPGITAAGGVTHQATDEVALMRIIPNVTVLETGDATEVEWVFYVSQAIEGPVYVRQLRGEVARLFPADRPMRLGLSAEDLATVRIDTMRTADKTEDL